MGIQKNAEVADYNFIEFSSSNKNIESEVFKEREFEKRTESFSELISEVDQANDNEFVIDKKVFDLRKHQDAKKNELERKIEERIQNDLIKIKDSAYQEGFQKGLQDGIAKAYEEERLSTEQKIQQMKAMVDNLLNRQVDIIKTQEIGLTKLIRDLTKWIILKELKDDDEYIKRLIEKVVEENKKVTCIRFQVGRGVVASFKQSIQEINDEMKKIYNGQVEVVESSKIDKDAIEVELDSNILRANISDQLNVFNELFDTVEDN